MRSLLLLIASFPFIFSCTRERATTVTCSCDTTDVKKQLFSPRLAPKLTPSQFYSLDSVKNRQYWFDEIENIDSTYYTRLWHARRTNYHASNIDFKQYYKGGSDAELAIQIGPAGILWTYYTFVLRKEKCCYILTRSTFTHARFRYKAFSLISNEYVDSVFTYLQNLKRARLTEEQSNYMYAVIVDNRNEDVFDVLLEDYSSVNGEQNVAIPPDSSIIKFLGFLDTQIKWTETYPLSTEEPEHERHKTLEEIQVTGTYKTGSVTGTFKGTLTIEKRDDYMFYSWGLVTEKGSLLAAKSAIVDFNKIPGEQDRFAFVKAQVFEDIKNYEIRNTRVVLDLKMD